VHQYERHFTEEVALLARSGCSDSFEPRTHHERCLCETWAAWRRRIALSGALQGCTHDQRQHQNHCSSRLLAPCLQGTDDIQPCVQHQEMQEARLEPNNVGRKSGVTSRKIFALKKRFLLNKISDKWAFSSVVEHLVYTKIGLRGRNFRHRDRSGQKSVKSSPRCIFWWTDRDSNSFNFFRGLGGG